MQAPDIVERYAQPHVRALHPYVPGLQPAGEGWIKLNTNENPYPPSPRVGEAIRREIPRLRLYPVPDSRPVREAAAAHHGLTAAHILAGNGSDDVLNLLIRAFCGEERAAGWTFPSYSLYPTLVGIRDGRLLTVPFTRELRLPADEIVASGANIFFLTSPNAPTGVAFPNAELSALLERFAGVLVVDEAYVAFAAENAVDLVSRHPNLVVTRTFSKSYAMAGMRVGYCVAAPPIIELLDRVRDSYNLDRLAQAAAVAALGDQEYHRAAVARVVATRDRFRDALRARGWFTYPSATNFVFTEPVDRSGRVGGAVAAGLYEHLRAHRILVRYFPGHPLTESFLRVSIGTDDQMQTVSATFDQWLQDAPPPSIA